MINDLDFLRGEVTKIRNAIAKNDARNPLKYGTLVQTYLTITANVERMENYQAQVAAEKKRKEEEKKAFEEAEKEIKEEK